MLRALPLVVVRAKALIRLRDRRRSRWLFDRYIGPGLDPEAILNLVADFLGDPAAQLP